MKKFRTLRAMKRTSILLFGILIGVLLLTSFGSVFAASLTTTLDVTFKNIQLYVDGKLVTPKDASGNTVEPFISNGTTYLPVRAVADALGKDVTWDATTNSVIIGDTPIQAEKSTPDLPLNEATPDSTNLVVDIGSFFQVTDKTTDNEGNTYSSSCVLNNNNTMMGHPNDPTDDRSWRTLLKKQYKRFTGTVFIRADEQNNGATGFSIVLDGDVHQYGPIDKNSKPIYIDLDVSDINDFRIYTDGGSAAPWINFGDSGFYR